MAALFTVGLTLFLGAMLGGAAVAVYTVLSPAPSQVRDLCNARLTPTDGPIHVRAYVPSPVMDRFNASAMGAYFAARTGRDFAVAVLPEAALEDFKAEAVRWGPQGAIVARYTESPLFTDVPTDDHTASALAYSVYGSPCAFVSFQPGPGMPCELDGRNVTVQRDDAYLLHEMGHLLGVPDHGVAGVMSSGAYFPCSVADLFSPVQLAVIRSWGAVSPLPPPSEEQLARGPVQPDWGASP